MNGKGFDPATESNSLWLPCYINTATCLGARRLELRDSILMSLRDSIWLSFTYHHSLLFERFEGRWGTSRISPYIRWYISRCRTLGQEESLSRRGKGSRYLLRSLCAERLRRLRRSVRTEAGPAESSESSKSDISESRSSISSSEISSSRSEISGINGPLKLRHQIHQKRVRIGRKGSPRILRNRNCRWIRTWISPPVNGLLHPGRTNLTLPRNYSARSSRICSYNGHISAHYLGGVSMEQRLLIGRTKLPHGVLRCDRDQHVLIGRNCRECMGCSTSEVSARWLGDWIPRIQLWPSLMLCFAG